MRSAAGLYYGLDGKPCSRGEGLALLTSEKRRVALTELGNGWVVSTVFLVIDHGFGCGPPVLWETMTFAPDRDVEGGVWRYTSREAAEKGHDDAVRGMRERHA